MRVKKNCGGQTLVETAIVLPIFGVFIFGVVWLICFGHNAIALQKMALDKARLVTADPSSLLLYAPTDYKPLWGQTTWPIPHRKTMLVAPWRPFIPTLLPPPLLPTVQKAQGSIIQIRCDALQTGRGRWTSLFQPKWVRAGADLIEPPTPPNS